MACGMEHGMEYGICLIYLLKDNYVTTTTFRGIYDMVLCTVASPGGGGVNVNSYAPSQYTSALLKMYFLCLPSP